MLDVYGYVDHTNLPNPRANWWGPASQDELFLAVDLVTSQGQPLGMIVAKDKLTAQKAAKAVIVHYEDLPIILTIEEAIASEQYHMQYDRSIIVSSIILPSLFFTT